MGYTAEDLLRLLDLEPIEVNIYRGTNRDIGSGRVFGGQVLAQALVAARRTIDEEREAHSLHGYFILPGDAGYGGSAKILGFWRKLLGQNVIALDDLDAVCETIALTVGLGEEAIDLAEGLDDLAQVGSAAGAAVGKALARLGSPSVVRAPAPAGLDESEPWDGLVRL